MKSILIHVDNSRACKARVETAVSLAEKFNAHITALHVVPNYSMPVYAEASVGPEIIELIRQAGQESANEAKILYETIEKSTGAKLEWRSVQDDPVNTICEAARCFDLTILGQFNPDDPNDLNSGLVEHVVPGAGAPCLVVPYIGETVDMAGTVLIAWNGTREAARAVRDAIPILQMAMRVEILCINPRQGDQENRAGAGACANLLHHGIKSKMHRLHNKDISTGDILLSHAADMSADLLVTGAYGHTRLREKILGGVTRHLLEHMTVPVLMSH